MPNNWEFNWQSGHWQRAQRRSSIRCMICGFGSVSVSEYKMKALPLQDRRILVTRTHEQAGAFSEQLRALGAMPVEFPAIRIMPPEDWEPLDNALSRLCTTDWYDWLIFTSANGVRICFERLRSLGYDTQVVRKVRVGA